MYGGHTKKHPFKGKHKYLPKKANLLRKKIDIHRNLIFRGRTRIRSNLVAHTFVKRIHMLRSTEYKYISSAKNFIAQHFYQEKVTPDALLQMLDKVASQYQPRSFTNIKCHLAFYAAQLGHPELAQTIKAKKNWAASEKSYTKINKKKKTLTNQQLAKIMKAVNQAKDERIRHATYLALYLGCRPCEMPFIKRTGETNFIIQSAKKNTSGTQGVDRHINVSVAEFADQLENSISLLKGTNMDQVRENFSFLMKATFPKMKKRPTLYVFRHQFGSTLKNSGLPPKVQAYLMGHQSTRTIESYGRSRSGKGKALLVEAFEDIAQINQLIRDTQIKRVAKRNVRFERLGIKVSPSNNERPYAPSA
jgi:hypothetical protein